MEIGCICTFHHSSNPELKYFFLLNRMGSSRNGRNVRRTKSVLDAGIDYLVSYLIVNIEQTFTVV